MDSRGVLIRTFGWTPRNHYTTPLILLIARTNNQEKQQVSALSTPPIHSHVGPEFELLSLVTNTLVDLGEPNLSHNV